MVGWLVVWLVWHIWHIWLVCHPFLPIRPPAQKLAVVQLFVQNHTRHREQNRGFGAGPRGQPIIRHRSGIRQARVHHREFRAAHFRFDDALRVWVEIVSGLEVRRNQQDVSRVGVIGRGAVVAVPERIAEARGGRADVGVRVVRVNAPRLKDPVNVAVGPRSPDVVHDFIAASLDDRFADAPADVVEYRVPRDAFPLALAALARAFQRIQNAFGVGDLIVSRRPFGAVAAARTGMRGVAFELADLQRLFVEVREQAAARLAIEADGWHEHVMLFDALGPVF